MDLGNRIFTLTVDGSQVPPTLRRCARCPAGTDVYQGGGVSYEGHLGHLVVTGNRLWALAMVSGGCPGDVSVSTAHGLDKKGQYRTQMRVRGLRALVRASGWRVERRERVYGAARYVFERTVWADGSRTVRAYVAGSAEPFREWTACGMWTDPAYLGECV